MLNEELIKQAAFDVQHKIVDLNEYKLSVSSKESNESHFPCSNIGSQTNSN
ncbi:MAG: hypothetical protein ACK6A9_05750 [Dolichospermum sp.]|jgi:hypothetical protein